MNYFGFGVLCVIIGAVVLIVGGLLLWNFCVIAYTAIFDEDRSEGREKIL